MTVCGLLFVAILAGCARAETKPTWQEQYDLGVRYLNEGKYEEAIIAFTAAIEIDPKNPDLYVSRANAYTGIGDNTSARADYETAIEINDTLADAWLGLADTYAAEGNIEKALEILQSAAAKTNDPHIKARIEELESKLNPPHVHTWLDATCTEPRTCSECGETEGKPLGHDMQTASDGFPSICSRCGYYEGELVTDAYVGEIKGEYGDCHFSIPRLNIAGETVESINKEIWDELYVGVLEKIQANRPYVGSEYIKYEWAVNGNILSLWIESHPVDWAWWDYYVYNVAISTGTPLSSEEVISAAGLTTEEYYEKVKQVLGSGYWYNWERNNEQFYNKDFVEEFNQQLRKTISDENIRITTPFFNSSVQLCFLARVYSMAGADYYWGIHNLDDFEFLPYYAEDAVLLTHNVNITEDEAYKMACDYWNYVPGSLAEETGFELFLVYDGLIEEYDGNHYHSFRLRWLVPMEAGIGNYLSTVDYLYINAETGECKSYI